MTSGLSTRPVAADLARARQIPQYVTIQYLRALAALGVVAFHALETSAHRFPLGAAGVDVFFVISGFIMWTVSHREARPAVFLWRRITRITPPYWIATLLIAAIAVIRPKFLWGVQMQPAHLLQSLLFVPHLDPMGRPYPLLLQGWTLNYEMFFYVAFALSLFLPRRSQLLALTAVLLGLGAVGLAARPEAPAAHTYTSPLLWEFAAGAWLAWLSERGIARGAVLGAILVLAAVAGFVLAGARDVQESPLRWLVWGAPALALVAGAVCLEGAGRCVVWRPLKLIGDSSYSIYLFHVPVLAACYRLFAHAPVLVMVAGALVASAVAGVVMYEWMERPLMRWAHRIGPRQAQPAPAMANTRLDQAAV